MADNWNRQWRPPRLPRSEDSNPSQQAPASSTVSQSSRRSANPRSHSLGPPPPTPRRQEVGPSDYLSLDTAFIEQPGANTQKAAKKGRRRGTDQFAPFDAGYVPIRLQSDSSNMDPELQGAVGGIPPPGGAPPSDQERRPNPDQEDQARSILQTPYRQEHVHRDIQFVTTFSEYETAMEAVAQDALSTAQARADAKLNLERHRVRRVEAMARLDNYFATLGLANKWRAILEEAPPPNHQSSPQPPPHANPPPSANQPPAGNPPPMRPAPPPPNYERILSPIGDGSYLYFTPHNRDNVQHQTDRPPPPPSVESLGLSRHMGNLRIATPTRNRPTRGEGRNQQRNEFERANAGRLSGLHQYPPLQSNVQTQSNEDEMINRPPPGNRGRAASRSNPFFQDPRPSGSRQEQAGGPAAGAGFQYEGPAFDEPPDPVDPTEEQVREIRARFRNNASMNPPPATGNREVDSLAALLRVRERELKILISITQYAMSERCNNTRLRDSLVTKLEADFKKAIADYEGAFDKFMLKLPPNLVMAVSEVRESLFEQVHQAVTAVKNYLRQIQEAEKQFDSLKLPKIELQRFSGLENMRYALYVGWRHQFEEQVDQRRNISDSQKLWYLGQATTDDALRAVKPYFVGGTIEEAISELDSQYWHPNFVVQECRALIKNLPTQRTQSSAPTLRRFFNAFKVGLNTLKHFKGLAPGTGMDLVDLVLPKLPTRWLEKWEAAILDNPRAQTISYFISYMDYEVRMIEKIRHRQVERDRVTDLYDPFSTNKKEKEDKKGGGKNPSKGGKKQENNHPDNFSMFHSNADNPPQNPPQQANFGDAQQGGGRRGKANRGGGSGRGRGGGNYGRNNQGGNQSGGMAPSGQPGPSSSQTKCVLGCSSNHTLNKCQLYHSKNAHGRYEALIKAKGCYQCLKQHKQDCEKRPCQVKEDKGKVCGMWHHGTLHEAHKLGLLKKKRNK